MNRVVTTPNLPDPFNWNENFKWIAGCITFLLGQCYYIRLYFKNKEKEKQEFIINVVQAAVKATLASELQGIKDDIKILFKYRDDDRNHSDGQFKELMREIKK